MFRHLVVAILLIFFVVFSGSTAQEGLIAYLSFDDGTGNVAKDSSGLGNDGQVHNAEWVDGKFEKALSFNGTDAYVEIPYNDDFNITEGITLAAWVKIDHLPLNPPYRGIINAKKSTYGPYLLQTSTLDANADEVVVIGHYYSMAGRWFHGIIDEVAIYNQAISEGEVQELYTGGRKIKAVSPKSKFAVSWGELKTKY